MMSKMPPFHELPPFPDLPPYERRQPEYHPHEVNDAALARFSVWFNPEQAIEVYVSPAHAKTWRGRLLLWLAGMRV